MPDTVIAHVNELSYNEPNKFIFTELSGCPIGDIYITGVDRDAADRNINNSPWYPNHKLQATEEAEEETVIRDPNIDIDINHDTPTE